MSEPTRESVLGGLYVMWAGNPHLSLGRLVETFAGAEGFEVAELPDREWPLRPFQFCPFCGGSSPSVCLGAGGECLEALWE